jgi:hypothetical protein
MLHCSHATPCLGQGIFPNTFFSDIGNWYSLLRVRDHVSYVHKTYSIITLCILSFSTLGGRRYIQNKLFLTNVIQHDGKDLGNRRSGCACQRRTKLATTTHGFLCSLKVLKQITLNLFPFFSIRHSKLSQPRQWTSRYKIGNHYEYRRFCVWLHEAL